jgi:hypothetical protein
VISDRQVREDLAFPLVRMRQGRRHRHVADGTLVLDIRAGARMVDRFPAHARLPVGIARELAIMVARQADPMDTSSPDGVIRLLWHGMQLPPVLNSVAGSACIAMTEG